jgi:hypothetical protein
MIFVVFQMVLLSSHFNGGFFFIGSVTSELKILYEELGSELG